MGAPFTPPEPATLADVRREMEALLGSVRSPKSGEPPAHAPNLGDEFHDANLRHELATATHTLHLRQQLVAAVDHGVDLLAALGLPKLVDGDFIRHDTVAVGDALAQAIALLDALDGDPDLEDGHDAEDGADREPSLGAPENHPGRYHMDMDGREYFHRKRHPLGDQTTWAAGGTDDREDGPSDLEPEAGYDLPEGDDERCGSEHDGREPCEDGEPTLGAPIGDGDQRHWAQGPSAVDEPELDPLDNIARRRTSAEWEAVYARRPALHALAAEARALRFRAPVPGLDPDAVMPIKPGMVWWRGPTPYSVSNVAPPDAWVPAMELSNLRELKA